MKAQTATFSRPWSDLKRTEKNQTLWHNSCFTQTISYLTLTGSPYFPTASLKADKTVEDRLFVERVKNVITRESIGTTVNDEQPSASTKKKKRKISSRKRTL